jgi:hypothetical protein
MVESSYKKVGLCQAIARSKLFADFTIFVVILNAVYLGIDSDHNSASNIYDSHTFFLLMAQFFCSYFTWELLVRFLAFEKKCDCWRDGWFKFDLFLVITMILDTWVLMVMLKVTSSGDRTATPTQPLRILRLAKITRMARLMKSFPELVTMIKGLFRSLRAIASSMVLIAVMTYTWSIFLHMLLKEDKSYNTYLKNEYDYEFTDMMDCMWTLLMAGTLMLDDSAKLMTELILNKDKNLNRTMAGLAIVVFALLSALLILQMLIGVLCDVVSQVGSERREAECVGLVRQEILEEFMKFDNGEGKITKDSFNQVISSPSARALLKKMNINRLFLTEILSMLCPTQDHPLPIRTALDVVVMCRGDNVATVTIIANSLCFMANEVHEMQYELQMSLHKVIHEEIRYAFEDDREESSV